MSENQRVSVNRMTDVIMEGLTEYVELAGNVMKDCVRKAGDTVRRETKAGEPVKTGRYKKSWAVKQQRETSNVLEVVVHSRDRYQLTHLLEKGHAKRGAYFKRNELDIEVYTDLKDPELEEGIEAVLLRHGIFYGKSEVWIESKRLYEVLYEMEV